MALKILSGKQWLVFSGVACAMLAGCRNSEFSRLSHDAPTVQYYGDATAPHAAAVRWQLVGSALMEEICSNKSLRELSIVTARREGTEILPQVASLPNLETLNLIEAPITDEELRTLAQAEKLQSLELSRTGITGEGLRHLAKLPLKRLIIREQSLTREGLEAIASMTELEELELCLPEARWAELPTLASKSKLRSVTLNGGFFSYRKFGGLKGLVNAPNLESMSLSGSNLNDRTIESIGTFSNLQSLSIERCEITQDGVEHLARLKHLRFVQLPVLDSLPHVAVSCLAECVEESNDFAEEAILPARG